MSALLRTRDVRKLFGCVTQVALRNWGLRQPRRGYHLNRDVMLLLDKMMAMPPVNIDNLATGTPYGRRS